MKIAFVSRSVIPSRFADSVHVMRMCSAFAEHDNEVTLYVPDWHYERLPDDPFSFYGIERTFDIAHLPWLRFKGRGFVFALHAARLAKQSAVDLVYGLNLYGCYFAALLGLPVIYEIHYPDDKSGWRERLMIKPLLAHKHLKGLVVISGALKEYHRSRYRLSDSFVLVAPEAAGEPGAVDPVALSNGARLQIGYVGQLYPGKGMEVIAELAPKCDWADFHVVGGLERDLERWRRRCQGVRNLTFHGFVAPAKTEAYRQAFDIALAPYQPRVGLASGTWDIAPWMSPLKVFEYMASRKPIVCSDLPVLREFLSHDENALLCKADDVESWRQALLRLRDSPELRQRLGEATYQDFVERYSWQARARNVIEFASRSQTPRQP